MKICHGRGITIKKWILMYLFGFLGILLVGMMLVFGYTERMMREQLAASNGNVLEVYMGKIDGSLIGTDRYLKTNAVNNISWSVLAVSDDPLQRNNSIYNMRMELQKNALIHDVIDGLFFFSKSPEGNIYLSQRSGNSVAPDEIKVRTMIEAREDTDSAGWKFYELDGDQYLINIVSDGTNCMGAWVRADHLLNSVADLDFGGAGFCAIVSSDGELLSTRTEVMGDWSYAPLTDHKMSAGNGALLQIEKKSASADFSAVALIPESVIDDQLATFRSFIYAIFAVIVLLIPLTSILLNGTIVKPILDVVGAMELVEKGDLSTRLISSSHIVELGFMTRRFNTMTERIETLTEDVYQRTIREQKIKLQYLQLQVKPHFFLNTLNLIYSFAQIKRMDLIQKLTLHLVDYFRYQFTNASDLVKICDEVGHIKDYMAIQELRFPGMFRFECQVEAGLEDAGIPPLLLQTFIENSVKYTMDTEENRLVSLEVRSEHSGSHEISAGEKEWISVIISDNGEGYSEEVLNAFHKKAPFYDDEKRGIGIYNAMERLLLVYGEAAGIMLENGAHGGARTVIRLPKETI